MAKHEIENLKDRFGNTIQFKDKELREKVDQLNTTASAAVDAAQEALQYKIDADAAANTAVSAAETAEESKADTEAAATRAEEALEQIEEITHYEEYTEQVQQMIDAQTAAIAANNTAQLAVIDQQTTSKVAAQVAQMQVIEGQTVIDSTLTVSGAAAEAKTVGDAVTELKNDLTQLLKLDGEFLDLSNVTFTDGSYISNRTSGTIDTSAAFTLSDYIEIPEGAIEIIVNRVVYLNGNSFPQSSMISFYNANYEILGQGTVTTDGDIAYTTISNNTAKYMRINFAQYIVPKFVKVRHFPSFKYVRHQVSGETVDDFTQTGLYLLGTDYTNFPTGINGYAANLRVEANRYGGITQTLTSIQPSVNKTYTRTRTNNGTWGSWRLLCDEDDVKKVNGFVGEYTGTFTSKNTIDTGIKLLPNKTYFIKFYTPRTGDITVFGQGNTSNLERFYTFQDARYFTNDSTARNLFIYNITGALDTVTLKVFETDAIVPKNEQIPKKYIVSKNAQVIGDYTSLTQCLLDLKDDHDPKIIEIWEGDYDIYQEYIDAGVPVYTGSNPSMEYWDYCVWIPKNTHIIGKGIVRLIWMPTKANNPEITWMQCYAVSPVNVADTMTLENVEIHCKNGRYCIHNDALGKEDFIGAVQKFINVKCYKYECDIDNTTTAGESHYYGTRQCTGFGMDRSMHHLYENCEFHNENPIGRAFYGHSRATVNSTALKERECGEIVMNNCIFDNIGDECIKFGNSGTDVLHIRVKFNSCYIKNRINLINEGSGATVLRNAFDVTFLNCGTVNMVIADTDNQYTPKAYGTTLNLT